MSKNKIFASLANIASSANENTAFQGGKYTEIQESGVTPHFSREVYTKLPELLKRACNEIPNGRERDVFLTGALTVLSGCFNNVTGLYDNREVRPNLFSFIVAPPASGKGNLSFAKELGMELHRKQLKQASPGVEGNIRPLLYIPGNISSAAIVKHLAESNGKAIMCETEADTLNNSLKQDWGNFSDLLRKCFHHETVSISRKTNNEYAEISAPSLSVCLAGTPSQVHRLIPSAEDGLFSRFMFYTYEGNKAWKDISPTGRNLTEYYKDLSKEVLIISESLEQIKLTFEFTKPQWRLFNWIFRKRKTDINELLGEEASASITRLGLITYRIAMVLSLLRSCDVEHTEHTIVCGHDDFMNALRLSNVFLEHALSMYNSLPKANYHTLKPLILTFINSLPNTFKRDEAVEHGERLGISSRSVGNYLKTLTPKWLTKSDKYGYYMKTGPLQSLQSMPC